MWITTDVNLPEPLIAAQRDGRLVIFVGAGASVGPPSNLPSFHGLAKRIADEARVQFEPEGRSLDRFLADVADNTAVDVHKRVHAIIGDPKSRHTRLHSGIAGLFATIETVRLVTTNYDLHLTTAVHDRFDSSLPIYSGPALPLGRDFHGLVYLHGCVAQPPSSLLVTDRDFGAAYLVDAWAARFLEAMFRTDYVVLFIGYSHDDVVMTYLARGLPSTAQRYALTSNPQGQWRQLGITPVRYPSVDDDHRALTEAVLEWKQRVGWGLLDHERQVRDIVAGTDVLDPPTASYLHDILADPITASYFTQHARGLEWLNWLEEHWAFQSLFKPNAGVGEVGLLLARWFAATIVPEHSDEALSVLHRQGGRLHPALANEIGRKLWTGDPSSDVSHQWVSVLLREPNQVDDDVWSYLLAKCTLPDDLDLALLLFAHLTHPRVRLRPLFFLLEEERDQRFPPVRAELVRGEDYWLREAWTAQLKPHLGTIASTLAPIVTHNLALAQLLLGHGNDGWDDDIGSGRSAIEPHEQDSHGDAVDILIDAARDVLEVLLRDREAGGVALLDQWSQLPGALFRRLVLHGWVERSDKTCDEKLAWLLAADALSGPTKHEAFRLLRVALPGASLDMKNDVLAEALKPPALPDGADPDHGAYVVFNLVYWLTLSDPEFRSAADALDDIQHAHPDFGPREYPDLDSWHSAGTFGPPVSVVSVDELVVINAAERLAWLRSHEDIDEFGRTTRDALLNNVANAVAASPTWGLQLAQALAAESDWASDLWQWLIEGWHRATLEGDHWRGILSLLLKHGDKRSVLRATTRLLLDGVRPEGTLPGDLLDEAGRVAAAAWTVGTAAGEADEIERVERNSVGRPYDDALNSWSGDVATFWVNLVSRLWRQDTQSWKGIPSPTKSELGRMLAEPSIHGRHARSIALGDLAFLFGADENWTLEQVLPLLDWTRSSTEAAASWHAYLAVGGWNNRILPMLMPLFRSTFGRLSALGDASDRFAEHLASIAVHGPLSPVDDGWLEQFIAEADVDIRIAWARHLERVLRKVEPNQAADQWDRWISVYWLHRNEGLPRPMTRQERSAMALWALTLGGHFPDAVALAVTGELEFPQQTGFIHRLTKEETVTSYPRHMGTLLAAMAAGSQTPLYSCHHLGGILARIAHAAVPDEYVAICQHAARLGCVEAAQWLDAIGGT